MRLPSYQELSKEQDKINNLPLDKSYLVTGPPGTGKTVMALYRAQMLAKKKIPTWLLMRSRLLSQYTNNATKALKIGSIVDTFHAWFGKLYRRYYTRNVPSFAPFEFDWSQVLQDVSGQPPAGLSLEHLIIDEGQDLHKMFYVIARHVARNLTVFADENQRLCDDNSSLDEIRQYGAFSATHELKRNYRNSKEIAQLAAHFHTGLRTGVPDPPSRKGSKPVVQSFASLHETVEFIARYERNNPDLQIGILVPRSRQRDSLFNRLSKDGRTTNPPQKYVGSQGRDADEVDFDSPGIFLLCYASAKGLEFDTVFMPELQEVTDDIRSAAFKMKFYVLLSRARDNLFLTHSGQESPSILRAFPKELVEWR